MNTTQTVEQMQRLKFNGMAAAYTTQLELPLHQQLESHELIAQLIQAEMLSRNNERTAMYLKLARILPAVPEHIEFSTARNITKQQLALLLQGDYIQHGETVLISGPTGVGYVKQMIM